MPSSDMLPASAAISGYDCTPAPYRLRNEYSRKNDAPMAVMSGTSRGACRSGRYATRSTATAMRGDVVRGVRAGHEHVAVREVDHVEDAVHHGVAERDEGVDAALGQAELHEVEPLRPGVAAGAQRRDRAPDDRDQNRHAERPERPLDQQYVPGAAAAHRPPFRRADAARGEPPAPIRPMLTPRDSERVRAPALRYFVG